MRAAARAPGGRRVDRRDFLRAAARLAAGAGLAALAAAAGSGRRRGAAARYGCPEPDACAGCGRREACPIARARRAAAESETA